MVTDHVMVEVALDLYLVVEEVGMLSSKEVVGAHLLLLLEGVVVAFPWISAVVHLMVHLLYWLH